LEVRTVLAFCQRATRDDDPDGVAEGDRILERRSGDSDRKKSRAAKGNRRLFVRMAVNWR
jgi:hypothetical protein